MDVSAPRQVMKLRLEPKTLRKLMVKPLACILGRAQKGLS